ncbi:MAG TPA: ABC transporter permease subunit [Bordetella sp.]
MSSPSASAAPPRRRRWPDRPGLARVALPLGVLAAVAVLQEGLTRSGVVNPVRFPPMSSVVSTLFDEAASGRLWAPLAGTGANWLASLALSFLVALALAVALNALPLVHALMAPVIAFLRPMPCTALIPLVILSLGATAQGMVFLTTFGTVWQMLPVLARAVGRVDDVARDTARVFGFTPLQVLRWLTLRALEPHILTALRIGATASLTLLISMELLTGASGVGRIISLAYAGSNLKLMYAYVLLSGLLGIVVNLASRQVLAHRLRYLEGGAR